MALESEQNHLVEELASLEREYSELENIVFESTSLDPVTIERVKKRKEWVKVRLDAIRSVLYPEIMA
jgi:hypothetical protein